MDEIVGRSTLPPSAAAPLEPGVDLTAATPVEPSPLPQAAPRWAVIGIFILMVVGALGFARPFLVPVVLGFLLTLVFSPIRRFFDRRGLPSSVSALLIVGVLLAGLVAMVVGLAEPVSKWIEDAPRITREIERKIEDLRGAAATIVEAGEQIGDLAEAVDSSQAQTVVLQEPTLLSSLALVAPAVAAQVVFVLALLFFLLSSGDMIYEKIVHVMPTFRDKRQAMRIAYDIERRLSAYLLTITLINAALGVAIGLAMWAIGLPNPLLIGVVAFALNFVPYLGAILGASIAGVVGLVSLDELREAAFAAGAYFGLTFTFGQFLTPFFVGRRLQLNPVVVFLSVALCAWLWSVIGMLIATPLLVTVRSFCEHIPPLQSVGDFLSARGAEAESNDDAEPGKS